MPIDFQRLWGEWHWKRVYGRLYQEQSGQWLTPVEVFRPYYSNTVAEFAVTCFPGAADEPLDLVELGGGRGTHARLVLDHLQQRHSEIYDRVRYTIVDSSPTLHQLQQESLSDSPYVDKVSFVHADLLDVAEGRQTLLEPSTTPTVVMALELFDNLPHDKIRIRSGSLIEQAEVNRDCKDRELVEAFQPLNDPLLKEVLRLCPAYYRRKPVAWIPTVACGVLMQLAELRPSASVLVADFDWLPAPDRLSPNAVPRSSLPAAGEPLITDMDGLDHECYLHAPELSDILFPTDFDKLATLVRRVWPSALVRHQKQADFLSEYGADEVARTSSWLTGYNPMIHDFSNCSVLTIQTRTNCAGSQ